MSNEHTLLNKIYHQQKTYCIPHICELDDVSDSESDDGSISGGPIRERAKNLIGRWMTVSKNNPLTFKYLKSTLSIREEIQRHTKGRNFVPIHQLSILSWWWTCFITIVHLFTFILAPIRVGFVVKTFPLNITTIDYAMLFMDIANLVNIVMIFNTGYFSDYTQDIVLKKNAVYRNYIKTFFVTDLLSSIPLEFIALLIGTSPLSYFLCQLKYLLKFVRYKNFNRDFKNLTYYLFKVKKYVGVILSFLLIAHFSTCLFSFWGTVARTMGEDDIDLWWYKQFHLENSSDVDKYIYGYVLSISNLVSAGSGNSQPIETKEIILLVIIIISLSLFKIFLIVFLIEEFVAHMCTASKYLEVNNQLQNYMQHKQLPSAIQKKFEMYYKYTYQNHYFPEQALLSMLSEHLRAEIKFHQCQHVINSRTFKELPKDIMGQMIGKLQYEVYLPGDIITKAGAIADCMYFISSGTVAVYTPTGKEVCHLDDGDYFGETALLMKDLKRNATVIAIAITELFRLDMNDFREHIVKNKSLMEYVERVATTRINETIQLEEQRVRNT